MAYDPNGILLQSMLRRRDRVDPNAQRIAIGRAALADQQPVRGWGDALANIGKSIAGAYAVRQGTDAQKAEQAAEDQQANELYSKMQAQQLGGTGPDGPKIGDISPTAFTPQSLGKYQQSGRIGDLVLNPSPERAAAGPIVKDFYEGGSVIQKQFDPSTGQWSEVGRGPRWSPDGGGTRVSVTNVMPGDAKVPEALRTKFADYNVTVDQSQSAFDTLKQYNPDRADAALGALGILDPKGSRAQTAQNQLLFGIAKLNEQGALQAPDKAVAEAIVGNIFDPRLSQEARAAKYDELQKILDTAKATNRARVATTAPEKAPVADVSPSRPAVTPQMTPVQPQQPLRKPTVDDLLKKYAP